MGLPYGLSSDDARFRADAVGFWKIPEGVPHAARPTYGHRRATFWQPYDDHRIHATAAISGIGNSQTPWSHLLYG